MNDPIRIITPHYRRTCLESMHASSTLHQVDTDYCSKKGRHRFSAGVDGGDEERTQGIVAATGAVMKLNQLGSGPPNTSLGRWTAIDACGPSHAWHATALVDMASRSYSQHLATLWPPEQQTRCGRRNRYKFFLV
jgi:hypothetical protein